MNSNPLTGLPGNKAIYHEITKRLGQHGHFEVSYIDLDNFKPYNDNYGFEKGDGVIKALALILEESLHEEPDSFNFIGHIGGDDFILISRPRYTMALCNHIISSFKERLVDFHGEEDYNRGCYCSLSRKGNQEQYELLSLSIGIVGTEVNKIDSYAHLASLASEVKKAAKSHKGFSIVKDRRVLLN